MARIEVRLKVNRANILLVGALRLPIDRTLVQLRVLAGGRVDRVDVDDGHLFVQHLGLGLDQFAAAPVQRGAFNNKTLYMLIYALVNLGI